VSGTGKVFAVGFLAALAWAVAPVAETQKPIRIGATVSQTDVYSASRQNQLRGYQLCVQHGIDPVAKRLVPVRGLVG
jgi:hypothetical protein